LAFDSVRWNGERNDDANGDDCGLHLAVRKNNYPISNYNTAMLTHNPLTHKTRPEDLTAERPAAITYTYWKWPNCQRS